MDGQQILYSGWRRKRGLGFFGFSQGETIVLGVLLFVVLFTTGLKPMLLFFTGPILLVAAALMFRYKGIAGWDFLRREISWRWAASRGYLDYQSGLISREPQAGGEGNKLELPGLLAPTRLLGMRDGYNEWGLVWDQSSDYLTVTLLCNSQSPALTDEENFNIWVAQWHHWLAALGLEPQIEFVCITIETSQSSGVTVAENIRQELVPSAPRHAYDIVSTLSGMGQENSALVETKIAITFNPSKGPAKGKTIDERTAEVSRLMYGLENRLLACGLSSVRRATPSELAANLRVAFDPASREVVGDAMAKGAEPLRWSQAGPMKAHEDREYYLHDTGVSVSWVWIDGPRSPVPATILTSMMNPGPYPKRVSLLYEPSDPAYISRKLENERTALEAKRILMRKAANNESERDRIDREFASMAAREEARGAGFGDLSFFVTVTVPELDKVSDAKTDIASRATQSKLHLRSATCSHAALFAVGLGAGIHPAYKSSKGWF